MIGIIDVGGGLRGIYGAGVFDRCIDDNISFDYCIGVSAGSANAISFLGNQKGRNYRFYHDYSSRKEYMSFGNLLKVKQYIDLDYVYGTLTNSGGEDALDFPAVLSNKGSLTVVATNAETGEPVYFTKSDMVQDDYKILMASSSLPLVCKSYTINGIPCYDGGIADPVPIEKAIADGCDKIVLILTKPVDPPRDAGSDARAARMLYKKYPRVAERLERRYLTYNQGVEKAKQLQKEGSCIIIAPDDSYGMSTLTRDKDKLDMFYRKGYDDAGKIKEFLDTV